MNFIYGGKVWVPRRWIWSIFVKFSSSLMSWRFSTLSTISVKLVLDENIFINVICVETIFQHLGILKGPQDENMMKETLVFPMWNVDKWIFHSWKPKSTSEKNMKQRNQGLFNSHLFAHFLQFKYNLCWICEDVFSNLWNLKKHLGWEHNLCIFYI